MEQVPEMISTKDLSYICDIFNWNFIAAKNANCFSKKVNNEEIKDFLKNTYEMHKSICEKLINVLSKEGEDE